MKKKKEVIMGSIIVVLALIIFIVGAINEKLQTNNVKILFEDQEIKGVNTGTGKCVFTIDEKEYSLEISTSQFLQYVEMDTLSTKDFVDELRSSNTFEILTWYRIHGVYGDEAEDPIQLSFKKIDKFSDSCAKKFATIKKI